MMMPAPPPVPGVNLPQGVEQMTPPIGASLEPQPAVTDQAQGGMASPADKFAKMLQGVKAPPAPDVVKPSTPAAPRLSPIRGGNDLIQMLMLLGAANPRAQQTGLGQQLRR
jgi:hypothetical protein